MPVGDRPFIDGAGRRGTPKKPASIVVKGTHGIRFRLLDERHLELTVYDKVHKISKKNAQRLAYWILENL